MPYVLAALVLGPLLLVSGWSYGIAPLMLYLARKPQPGGYTFVPLDLADATPDERVRLEHWAGEIQSLGFELVDYLRAQEGGSVHALLVSRTAGAMAFVCGLKGGWWVDFSTELEDGTVVNTSNLDDVQMFSPHPRYRDARLPGASSLGHLWLLHRKRVAAEGKPGLAAVLPPPGQEVARLTRGAAEPIQLQEEMGLYRREGGAFFLTLKGAYTYTPRLMKPTGQMRTRYPAAVAQRTMRALDARPTPPHRPVVIRPEPAPARG